MNKGWLKRIAQVMSPDEIIQQVLRNQLGVEKGGTAYTMMQTIGTSACDAILNVAGTMGLSGVDPSAYAKMKILAEAAGCDWNPQAPKQQQQEQPGIAKDPLNQQMPMPMLGGQEKPLDMPSADIGN